jgi:hypothetical protein
MVLRTTAKPRTENDMTTDKKVARRKLSLLDLASDLGNVSKACRMLGYSRQQFYEIRRNFQTYGADGLLDRLPGAKGPHPNRVAAEIETAILDHALAHPCHGPMRVGQELMLRGIQVSSGGVRGVWQRHSLLTKHDRLLRLEKATAERKLALSNEQIRLLERFSPEYRERHIEAPHTGALALTAVQLLNNDVLPAFEARRAKIDAVLSDDGREFYGREDRHPYELFLQLEDIEHKRTRVNRPQSNGIVERGHRTLLDEHFRVKGRPTWFETLEEMQTVLDQYLIEYNTKRPHQGRGMNGRTPITAFIDGIRKEDPPVPNPIQKPPNLRPARRLLSADYPLCTQRRSTNSMHCSAKIQEWFAFHFSAGDDPATPSCLAPVEGLFNGIEAERDLSFIATGAARYGIVFEQRDQSTQARAALRPEQR